ncbi:hypothetical protein KM043_009219 [Ampulex compressa]|nr:hypothetical protein KM043_009219 [Ampulex compressa]
MDWPNEESDHPSVENFLWEERNLSKNAKSNVSLNNVLGYNVCSQGIQVSFENCKESRSFISPFEHLKLEAEPRDDTIPLQRTISLQTDENDNVSQEEIVGGFRTREMSSFRLVIQSPDILNFQGTRHAPEDVARYWKKDSRMWLWKSVRYARRKGGQQKPSFLEKDETG